MRHFIFAMLCVLMGFGSRVVNAETNDTKHLRERLVAIDQRRSRSAENMRDLEQAALALLSRDSSETDRSEVYVAIATMFANNGMRQPSKVAEYCEMALRGKTELLKACQLYVYWGEALERLTNAGSNTNVSTAKDALTPYLKGLKLVIQKQVAREKRDVPPLGRYRYDGLKNDPGYQIMLNKRAEAAAVRQEIMVQNELVDYRRILTDKCVALYSQGNNSIEEFEDTARGILKDPDLLKELVEAIRNKRKTSAGRLHSMTFLDLNVAKENADVIVVSMLDHMPVPYEVLGKNFYRIRPDDVLKGSLATNSLLVIETNVDSSEGKPAMVEPAFRYMLFLQKINLGREGLPRKFVAYRLIGNWKGIVSLDKKAAERRAIRKIQQHYEVLIDDMSQEFVDAVRFSVGDYGSKRGRGRDELSDSAATVYNALNLKQSR